MAKTVAVDDRFQKLIKDLRERGYNVVGLYDNDVGVDACIYYDGIRDFQNLSPIQKGAVLMMDGKGKDIDDIEKILQRGVYSSLF